MLGKKRQTKLHLRIEVGKIYVLSVGCLPCGSSPHALSKLIHELVPKVFNASFFHLMRSEQSMEVRLLSMRSVPKSAFGLMQKLSKCVRHAEEKRRKRKERPFGQ